MKKKKLVLGRIRTRIMQALWDKKRLTAQEITNAINEHEPVAHSTVQSHLRALESQCAVAHETDDRTFVFYPLIERDSVMKSKVRDLIDVVFLGSAESLVAYLADNKYVSLNEMKKALELFENDEPRE